MVTLDLNVEMHTGTSQVEKMMGKAKEKYVQNYKVEKSGIFGELHVVYIAGCKV